LKAINPDTFFFVSFKVNKTEYIYGPYLDLTNAIEILVDLAPAIAAGISKGKSYTYESAIHEKVISDFTKDGIDWKTINTPLKEEKSKYIKRSKN
jgi:hypothetical protein